MPFTQGLLLLFIGLKLAGFINWPWFCVLSPCLIFVLVAALEVYYDRPR